MDSITYFPPLPPQVTTLFFFFSSTEAARGRERRRHGNTQRYSETYRGDISLGETNFGSDTTLKISFRMWRVLNKATAWSTALRGSGYMSIRVSVPKAEVPDGSGEGKCRGQTRRPHNRGESHLCLDGGWGGV